MALYDGDVRAPGGGGGGAERGKTGKVRGSGDRGGAPALGGQPQVDTGLRWMSGAEEGGHASAVNGLCFFPDSGGRRLMSVGNDARVCLWDWEASAAPVAQLKHRSKINCVCSRGGGGAVIGDVRGRLTAVAVVAAA